MNEDAIERLASFERLADDAAMTPEQKVALAISGWLVGANQATDNFQVAVSLAHVRDMMRQYLREPLAAEPLASWPPSCTTWKARSVERVAQILKLMKPPLDVPKEAERGPRMFEFDVAGPAGRDRRPLLRAAAARIRSAAPLSDDRHARRRRRRRPSRCSTSGPARANKEKAASGSARRRGTVTS